MIQSVILMVPLVAGSNPLVGKDEMGLARPAVAWPLVRTIEVGPAVVVQPELPEMAGGYVGNKRLDVGTHCKMVLSRMLLERTIRPTIEMGYPGHFIGTGYTTETEALHARTETSFNYPELVFILSATKDGRRYTVTAYGKPEYRPLYRSLYPWRRR